MRYKILLSAPYMIPFADRFVPELEAAGCEVVIPNVNERLEEADLLELVGDIDGTICGDDRYTRRVIEAAPNLKIISKWGTGIDSIDAAACHDHGVRIGNTPNAFTVPVADSVLAYMLSFARRTPWMDTHMKAGRWEKVAGRSLAECTVGIIGVGNIGSAVARRAAAFGMTILGNDVNDINPDLVAETGMQVVSKKTLLRESDFVTLHCDLNTSSYHLMSTPEFAQMKSTAVLINTSRGPVVDEVALCEALSTGKLGGAGMDVFEHEPLPLASPLRQMDHVLLAPHNSNSSPRAWERVHQNSIKNLMLGLREVSRGRRAA